jgi:hypothetical protein
MFPIYAVVITGNPIDGFSMHGPFLSVEFARTFADAFFPGDGDCWIDTMTFPTDEDDTSDWSGLMGRKVGE